MYLLQIVQSAATLWGHVWYWPQQAGPYTHTSCRYLFTLTGCHSPCPSPPLQGRRDVSSNQAWCVPGLAPPFPRRVKTKTSRGGNRRWEDLGLTSGGVHSLLIFSITPGSHFFFSSWWPGAPPKQMATHNRARATHQQFLCSRLCVFSPSAGPCQRPAVW